MRTRLMLFPDLLSGVSGLDAIYWAGLRGTSRLLLGVRRALHEREEHGA